MACGPPPMCCLMSPATPGSPRCCWASWGPAASAVSPQLQLFLQLPALASSTTVVQTTCSKALITPHKGCFPALSSRSLCFLLFFWPKSLPCLLVLFSSPPLHARTSSVVAETPSQKECMTYWVPWKRCQTLVKIVECNAKWWGFNSCAKCVRRQILQGKILSVIQAEVRYSKSEYKLQNICFCQWVPASC